MSSFTTPPPKRHNQTSAHEPSRPEKLSCGCHAARCSTPWCMSCSKCCQSHNSRNIKGKEKRGRGRPRKETERAVTFARQVRKSTRHTGLLTPVSSRKTGSGPTYSKILDFFSFGAEESLFLCKHLPPRNLRRSEEFWTLDRTDDADRISQRLAVMRFYRALLFSIAESLCIDKNAAAASMESFAMWLRPDPTSASHQEVARSCMRAIANAKKGSIERRLVQATLCGTFQLRDLATLAQDVPGGAIGSTTYTKSRQDFDILLQVGELPKTVYSRQRFDKSAVDEAIRFILAYENVVYLSWGTKKVKLDGKTHDAPSILLKNKPVSVLFNQYKERGGETSISRPSFFRRAVPDQAASLKAKLDVVQAWLKYGSASQLDACATCPRHDVQFGLLAPAFQATEERAVSCSQCTSLHRLFQYVLRVVGAADVDASALGVIRDIIHKIYLFMGRRLRVVNQQRIIARMIADAKEECRKNRDHYGKRGMSWHGVQIRSWEPCIESESSSGDLIETVLDYDQLSSSDNKQDKGAVISLLEATMMALRRHSPHITRVVVQSDNASCYQNSCVILMLPIIGYAHGISVERYEHTETQDGTSPLDGHFGQAQRKVRRFVTQGNNCVTPTLYVVALVADGGLPNCVAELVEYNRGRVADLQQETAPIEAALSKIVGRANDIFYDMPHSQRDASIPFEIAQCPDFTMRVFLYSAVGSGTNIRVCPGRKTCTRIDNAAPYDFEPRREQLHEEPSEQDHGLDEAAFESSIGDLADCHSDAEDQGDVEQESSQALIHAAGVVTGVTICKTAQLVRRARQWRYAANALNALQETTNPHQIDGSEDKDMAAYAKRRLFSLGGSSEIGIVDAGDLPEQMSKIVCDIPLSLQDESQPLLKCGWARRPPNGKMYGAKYIRLFDQDIREMFERGAREKGEKLGAGRMVEELRRRYPGRFNFPSEGEVRAEVSRLFTLSRKRHGTTDEGHAPKRRTIPHEYAIYLEEVVAKDPRILPARALPIFRVKFPDSAAYFTDLQVRSKVSTLKRMYSGGLEEAVLS